ncbi:MAG TPA: hypothetical protein VG841_05065 [Caulobacterales bacterium]|nr:hypothetical protein [Caulobacterales bacterium]
MIRETRVNWPTHLRTFLIALAALALFGGAVTQLIAHLLRDDPRLGDGVFDFAGARFYAPWASLGWAVHWALLAPWFALIVLVLNAACVLAAYAVAILFAELQPITLFAPSPWRNLARWRELGDCGLLGDEGLPLGTVRRHAFAKHDFLRFSGGHCLILGDPKVTDDALIAALSGWNGALVMIDARGLSDRLRRQNVLRVAPGRFGSAAINPLFNIRGGTHAWSDAHAFARAFLRLDERYRPDNDAIADAFALLMLDQLLTAPAEARNLAALRRRLLDKETLLAVLCGRWAVTVLTGCFPPAAWEMARAARDLLDDLETARRRLIAIDHGFGLFADPTFASATSTHHLRFADLVAGDGPQTFVFSMNAHNADVAAPLVLGLLAQLAIACAQSLNAERRLLVVIEAEVVRALAPELGRDWLRGDRKPTTPLVAGAGFDLLVQAGDIAHATRDVRGPGVREDKPFDVVLAIGPQIQASAHAISELSGRFETYRRDRISISHWRLLMFRPWLRVSLPRLPAEELRNAGRGQSFLLPRGARPARIAVLTSEGGPCTYVAPDQLAPATHDWTAPPLEWPTAAASPQGEAAMSATSTAASAKLRRALTRTVTPKAKAKPKSAGRKTR